jgi:ribonucleotide monophosphatase NagD (HAD superfamily)
VGDNIAADIAGGLASGYITALMMTGVTHLSAENHHEIIPDLVFKAL